MGLVFGICLLLLCINSFLRILVLSAGYSNRFFQLFTYGAAVCYIFQTFLTVGGETKFIPLTGVTLPLVSYGGSSVLSTLIMLGIVEMIFILHDERTVRFMERYEMEHAGNDSGGFYGAPPMNGGGGQTPVYGGSGGPSVYGGTGALPAYGGTGTPENMPQEYDRESYGDMMPEDFPVNGISEEGIFDDY